MILKALEKGFKNTTLNYNVTRDHLVKDSLLSGINVSTTQQSCFR